MTPHEVPAGPEAAHQHLRDARQFLAEARDAFGKRRNKASVSAACLAGVRSSWRRVYVFAPFLATLVEYPRASVLSLPRNPSRFVRPRHRNPPMFGI